MYLCTFSSLFSFLREAGQRYLEKIWISNIPLLVPEAWVIGFETTRIGNIEGFLESDIELDSAAEDAGGEYFLLVICDNVFFFFLIIFICCYPNNCCFKQYQRAKWTGRVSFPDRLKEEGLKKIPRNDAGSTFLHSSARRSTPFRQSTESRGLEG